MRDDLIGRTFGTLRVERVLPRVPGEKTRFECRCLGCGAITSVRGDHIVSGHTTSCGCRVRAVLRERRPWSRINLRNQRRGRLVMLRPGPNIPSGSRYQPAGVTTWIVRCDCGREVLIPTRDLTRKRGPVTSCGCEHLKPAAPSNGASAEAPSSRPDAGTTERRTTAREALERFHDEHSPLGKVRRVAWPAEDDAEAGCVVHDYDPFK
jgi:hypothetical protein